MIGDYFLSKDEEVLEEAVVWNDICQNMASVESADLEH